ncbi:NAD dependent epimerase/dehydratase [Apiospora arundinis]|uniref:NAD dependent epimerase/dehydratase n=1 Tax=Apiospora arundinis TaxID=335852 RepID=A0ABR2HKN9_9PEZI
MPTKLLLTGATGYIGGTVLTRLRESTIPDIKALSITVLVRKPDQAAVFEGLGIPAIVGTLDDAEVLRTAAAAHDIVLHTAGATHQASIAPLLAGLAERRHQAASEEEAAAAPSSSSTYLIHTAGATMLSDYPITSRFRDDEDEGDSTAAAAARVFSDKHDDDIYEYLRRRQETDPYVVRTVALAAVDGGEAAGVGTCVVVPPRVYGRGTGLFNTRSQQIPLLIGGAVAGGGGDKVAEYVGSGEGVWDDVHVVDLAALYEALLGRILRTRTTTNTDPAKGNNLPTGRRGIYFTATGIRHSWKEVAESIGQAGYQAGLLDSVEPRSLTLSEAAEKYLGGNETYTELGLASNSLASADLAKDLGWVVTKTESDFQQGIVEEVESIKNGNVSQHNLAEVLANQAKAIK